MLQAGTRVAWSYVVLTLLYGINSGFALPLQRVLGKSEVAPSKFSMALKNVYGPLVSFFRPTTCRYKDEQSLVPCHVGEDLNTTECLENRCCLSKTNRGPKCYTPLKDNMQLTFRLLGLIAGGFFILGCLPFCCSACLRRSSCFNPLRRAKPGKVKQVVQKKRAAKEEIYKPLLEESLKDSEDDKEKNTV
ncbi:FMR1 neighbor protein [Colius striatus]|uniref:FMR1 neighbor protein n=1 Tax=Colius striatus TaxID=57412 RepID=UPI002B1DBE47|nr:FMR1 neighbor protein [Colius striatus]